MGRKSSDKTKITNRETVYCVGCDKDKKPSEFYKSYGATESGLLPYCKKCCIKYSLNNNGEFNVDKFKEMLQKVDRPFLYDTLSDNLKKYKKIESAIGFYFKDLGLVQNRKLKYKDSIFSPEDDNNKNEELEKDSIFNLSRSERNVLVDKFGYGYDDNEYVLFEKKYQELRPSFQLSTTMHEECLREYCIDKVKEGLAKARGDFKEAKEWASMAKEQANSGKLNPSQMSKSDLSGGLDSFGQMRRMVEQTDLGEMQRILPIYTEKPKDRVDITLWMYVNYVRDLKGLEECEYKDIWDFYNKRIKEYEKEMTDPHKEDGENND